MNPFQPILRTMDRLELDFSKISLRKYKSLPYLSLKHNILRFEVKYEILSRNE